MNDGPKLRTAWLTRRQHHGIADVSRWRTPGVDAVVAAVAKPSPEPGALERGLRMLAWERAASDSLDALLADVDALWAVLSTSREPMPLDGARSVAIDGWVDAVAAERGVPCIDPLSGLHTAGYLAGRLVELDRIGGVEPPSLVLLAVRWVEPSGPWLRIATILQVADALRAAVRPAATLCQDGAHTALALVSDDGTARTERTDLQRRLEAEPLSAARPVIELVPVPDQREHLAELLRSLRAEPSKGQPATASSYRMRNAE